MQQPIVEELAVVFKGKARFLTLDVDEHPKAAMQLGITSIPTLVIYRDGRELERVVGLQLPETLSAAIDKVIAQCDREGKR
jgi:thioredoxin 1